MRFQVQVLIATKIDCIVQLCMIAHFLVLLLMFSEQYNNIVHGLLD